ncbi:hypothetical protein [Variovorax sp. WS11]|uniref:hypothetical protein n=1 Tax=Variovorax sp. WS11 TaxID=1105204 RepID=UPI0011B1E657|nr:hypothetical protein [Variovorax sp. WS11]
MSKPHKMTTSAVEALIADLKKNPAGWRCKDMCRALERLQFTIRPVGSGHKVVSHAKLAGFTGTNFDCGHGKDPLIKPAYIRKLASVLEKWQDKLDAING